MTGRRLHSGLAITVSIALIAGGAGCSATPRIVPLLRVAGSPVTPLITAPLEVVSRGTAVADPLPVRNSNIVYGDIESALGIAVATATEPWAEAHRAETVARNGGWTVLVELTGADAILEPGGRLVVGLDVRATLRERSGNVYLGQTTLACRAGGLVSAEDGAAVVYRCMTRVGSDLAGWLSGGVHPADGSKGTLQ